MSTLFFQEPDGTLREIGTVERLDMAPDLQEVLYGDSYVLVPKTTIEIDFPLTEAGVKFFEKLKELPMSGRVLSCAQCGEVFAAQEDALSFDPCEGCGSDLTTVGTETPCPVPLSEDCHDDDHHHGRGSHITDDPE